MVKKRSKKKFTMASQLCHNTFNRTGCKFLSVELITERSGLGSGGDVSVPCIIYIIHLVTVSSVPVQDKTKNIMLGMHPI